MKSILTIITVVFCTVCTHKTPNPAYIVTDEEGSSLPGVSVTKGTSTGTVTNGEGKYSINADLMGL